MHVFIDIEEIAQKTGNYKNFDTFVKMLCTALEGKSDTVYVDLLTYGDLQLLRSKKNAASGMATDNAKKKSKEASNKRYLILTYAVEFDRVHYPLPLVFNLEPDVSSLKRTIQRLRRSMAQSGGGSRRDIDADYSEEQIRELEDENEKLRKRVNKLHKELQEYKITNNQVLELQAVIDMERQERKDQEIQLKRQISKLKNQLDLNQAAQKKGRISSVSVKTPPPPTSRLGSAERKSKQSVPRAPTASRERPPSSATRSYLGAPRPKTALPSTLRPTPSRVNTNTFGSRGPSPHRSNNNTPRGVQNNRNTKGYSPSTSVTSASRSVKSDTSSYKSPYGQSNNKSKTGKKSDSPRWSSDYESKVKKDESIKRSKDRERFVDHTAVTFFKN